MDASPASRGSAITAGFGRSAHRLVQNAEVKARVKELRQTIAEAVVTRSAVDRAYVLDGLKENFERAMQRQPVLDRKGKETKVYTNQGQIANRALELIGKELGMFVDCSEQFIWDGDLSKLSDAQLKKGLEFFERMRQEEQGKLE